MSKERLEEIRNMYENWLTSSHMGWLIEQAERVQELEERLNALITLKKSDANAMVVLVEQNKRYREAIEKAIEKLTWNSVESEKILLKALEGEEWEELG